MPELLVAIENLHLLDREVRYLNGRWRGMAAVRCEMGEREGGVQAAVVDFSFPKLGDEYRIVGWVHHKDEVSAIPLHRELAQDIDDDIQARMCHLLGRRQARNETWLLLGQAGVLRPCGPAGAWQAGKAIRGHLDDVKRWLCKVESLLRCNWGPGLIEPTPLVDFLAAVHACIRTWGFTPKSRSKQRTPTYMQAMYVYKGDEPLAITESDHAAAMGAIAFWREMEVDERDDFEVLLHKAMSEDVVQRGIEGAAAYAMLHYMTSQSQHVGEIGDLLGADVIPIEYAAETRHYRGARYKFLAGDNVLVWWSAKDFGRIEPCHLKFRVKKHGSFRGVTETAVGVLEYEEKEESNEKRC